MKGFPAPEREETKRPPVPGILKFYGRLFVVLHAIPFALVVALGGFKMLEDPFGILFVVFGIGCLILVFRLGKGMRRGERNSVYGFIVLGAIAFLFVLGTAAAGSTDADGFFWLVLIVYVVPVIVALRNWSSFE